MISYFSLGVLFWEVQVSRSMVYEPMKSPSSLTLAAFHLELLMKKVRRYSCPLFESRHSHPVLCTRHQPNLSLLLTPSVDKS